MSNTVLFLCTGNYYRSRFAEIWFNHLARKRGLNWRAESRGLNIGTWQTGWGQISEYAVDALDARGVSLPDAERWPTPCERHDLESADRVIAIKEAEHRPLLAAQFGHWADRVEYWHVHDLDGYEPHEALPLIAEKVEAIVAELA